MLIICAPAIHAQSDETIEISPLTNHVHNRFYIIERLTKTVHALYNLHNSCKLCLPKNSISFLQKTTQFENQLIKKCIRDMIKTQSLQPLFSCWQTIITYKYVDDQTLSLEFSHLVYQLITQLIANTKAPYAQSLTDLVTRDLESPTASTHQVSFRFYLLKRLTKSHAILNAHREHAIQSFPKHMLFMHPRTAQCYEKIMKLKSIEPVMELFDEVQQYRFIDDTVFMQEFLQLLFITHVCMFIQENPDREFGHSFEHITTLSITELLEAIDIEIHKYNHKSHSIPVMLEENFDFSPNHFAHYVYRRFYFIARLERIMNLFKEINQSPTLSFDHSTLFDFDANFSFKHTRIQESIRTMEHEHNLKPLFSVWDDFIAYKSIEDQLFVEEFTKEIFVISRNMLICSGICVQPSLDLRSAIGLPAQQLLDVIDMYTEQFLEHTPNHNTPHLETVITPLRMPDLQQTVHIDDVILRFYHVQRLGIIFWLLNEIQAKGIQLKLNYSNTSDGVLIDNEYRFTHEHIVSSIKIMEQTNSIEPLMGLMQGIQRYKYIDDEIFTREYLMLTLLTLRHLKLSHKPLMRTDAKIDDLPLEKILEALDIIAQELPGLLEKYEFTGTMSWKEWFKKYWWAPAIVLGTVGIKVYMHVYDIKITQADRAISKLSTGKL